MTHPCPHCQTPRELKHRSMLLTGSPGTTQVWRCCPACAYVVKVIGVRTGIVAASEVE